MWKRGGLEENGYMYIYGWLPLLWPDTIMTLSISYTPLQNKKLKNIMIYKEAFIEDGNDIMLMYPWRRFQAILWINLKKENYI